MVGFSRGRRKLQKKVREEKSSFIRRMFKIVRESFRDKTRDNVCAYLRDNLGIDAEMASNKTPEDIGATKLFRKSGFRQFYSDYKDLGSIKLRGKNIDLIQITRYSGYQGNYCDFDYAIKVDRADIEGKEKRLEAKTKITKKEGHFL